MDLHALKNEGWKTEPLSLQQSQSGSGLATAVLGQGITTTALSLVRIGKKTAQRPVSWSYGDHGAGACRETPDRGKMAGLADLSCLRKRALVGSARPRRR